MADAHAWHLERAIPVPETGCWLWLGAEKGNGYGNVRVGAGNQPAHRVAYTKAVGPIPEGMDVCHKCDTRSCINPDHLFVGSRLDNMRDAKRKGRLSSGAAHSALICGEKGALAKLTVTQVVAIRKAADGGVADKDIAAIAGVTVDNIRRIVRHETWKEIDKCAA